MPHLVLIGSSTYGFRTQQEAEAYATKRREEARYFNHTVDIRVIPDPYAVPRRVSSELFEVR